MRALISPNEVYTHRWVTSWQQEEGEQDTIWTPEYSTINNCQRVVEVKETEFQVALPLFWVDCVEECTPADWYFKDNELHQKPKDVEKT
jgi:hypothetical protein